MAQIIIDIDDLDVTRAIDAFTGLADENLEINGLGNTKDFEYSTKATGETNIQFGKRVIAKIMVQFVKLYEKAQDKERFNSDIEAIEQVTENVPDDLIT